MPVVLIIFGGVLILLSLKAKEIEKPTFKSILKDREENATEINLEIIQLRKEMAESLLEIQQEIESIKLAINLSSNEKDEILYQQKLENLEAIEEKASGVISEINFDGINKLDKVSQVELLLKQNLTDDEICNKLSIGKGEILLIKSLLKGQKK